MAQRPLLIICTSALLLGLAACQGDGPTYVSTGPASPTVAGAPPPSYTNYNEARHAFTRTGTDGTLTATLKDAAWIRFEGDPDGAAARHRAYFQGVATVFEVIYRPKEYTRVNEEVFVLEDSSGTRLTAKPKKYEGEMALVGDRFHFTFDLAFAHALSSETRWVRLTHVRTGEVVEWTFTGGAAGPATAGAARGTN